MTGQLETSSYLPGLPPALSAWGPELSDWPEDLILTLEPWLLRLSAALGPPRSAESHGDGPPDGFAGLTRRGSYERLLTTEWLLAEQHPEEFLRRATQGEHLFYALARQSPAGTTRTRVLFDAGPHQQGAPRVVHLALLLTLARRARAGGADFVWGVLQDPQAVLHPDVSKRSVLDLLAGRSIRPALPEDFERWTSALALGPRPEADDLWLVGGAGVRAVGPPGARRVVVQEPLLDLAVGPVDLSVESPGHPPRTVRLALPPSRAALRLLRDPFEVIRRHPAPDRGPAGDGLVFTSDGRTLFARSGPGVLMRRLRNGVFPDGPPTSLSAGGRPVVAVGHVAKRTWLLLAPDASGRPRLLSFNRHRSCQSSFDLLRLPEGVAADPPGPLTLLMPQGGRKESARLYLDASGHLVGLTPVPDSPATVLCRGVTGLGRDDGQPVFVVFRSEHDERPIALRSRERGALRQADLPRRAVVWLAGVERVGRIVNLPSGSGSGRAFFGLRGSVAVEVDAGRWYCLHPRHEAEVDVPGHEAVVGALPFGGEGGQAPGVVTLDGDRRRLHLRSRHERRTVALEQPALQIALSPGAPVAAYTTAGDGLGLIDLGSGGTTWLRRSEPGA